LWTRMVCDHAAEREWSRATSSVSSSSVLGNKSSGGLQIGHAGREAGCVEATDL